MRFNRTILVCLLGFILGACSGSGSDGADVGDQMDGQSVDDLVSDVRVEDGPGDSAVVPPDQTVEEVPGQDGVDQLGDFDTGATCSYSFTNLLPGPCQEGFDQELEKKAFQYDRQFHLFNGAAFGVNTDVSVDLTRTEERAAIESFLRGYEGWDFETVTGKKPSDLITSNGKVAGLYAGVGIMADAYRYAVLRDQGYAIEEVDLARVHLLRALETLNTAQEITGVEGVICRGLAKKEWSANGGYDIVPLFDETGAPLPTEKNNGVWRADNSGKHPDLIWEDSVSRDMLIGWALAMAGAWEVVRDDSTIDQAIKTRMQSNALALAKSLMVVRPSGYDLEVPDADGRTTLHGYLNEHNMDGKFYSELLLNGFHSIMALGIVAAYAYVSEDDEVETYLNDVLIKERDLPGVCLNSMMLVDMGLGSNYSNSNMAFTGAWLAMRYIKDTLARGTLRLAIKREMYDRPGQPRQPAEIKYTFYDFIYSAAMGDHSAWAGAGSGTDEEAIARGLETLHDFATPPYWDFGKVNCPDAVCDAENPEVANPECVGIDGTAIHLLGCVGRNGDLVADKPIPWRILGPSNFHWRTNPYMPNFNGNGSNLLPGVDFRGAYWMGRYVRRAED